MDASGAPGIPPTRWPARRWRKGAAPPATRSVAGWRARSDGLTLPGAPTGSAMPLARDHAGFLLETADADGDARHEVRIAPAASGDGS